MVADGLRERPAMVLNAEPFGGDLWAVRVGLDEPIPVAPGQFVELALAGDQAVWRHCGIASPSALRSELELMAPCRGGPGAGGWVEELETGLLLRVRGPFGRGYRPAADRPVVLVADSLGVAPVLAVLRTALGRRDAHSFTFLLGVGGRTELVLADEIEVLQFGLDLTFVPILSHPTPACGWRGRVGHVAGAVERLVADARGVEAYVCGAPEMRESVGAVLRARGIDTDRLFVNRIRAASVRRRARPHLDAPTPATAEESQVAWAGGSHSDHLARSTS